MINWMEQTSDAPAELAGLTDQQLRILGLLAEGLTNREIGTRLYLAEKTVKNHVTRILAKLGVQRRTQAALLASRLLSR
jgi:DNA-binding NarL/FixJ family response regulator